MDLETLRYRLVDAYRLQELELLCGDLQARLDRLAPTLRLRVRVDDLGGQGLGLETLIAKLFDRLKRRGQLRVLFALIRERRPDLDLDLEEIETIDGVVLADECPYPGLQAFTDDGRFPFFGRQAEVRDALTVLKSSRFLAVIGRTGSGKSSLVLAGVVPEWRARSGGAKFVEYVYMRPGTDPGASMAAARARLGAAANKPALLVIDQFEELFRSTRDVVVAVSAQIDAVLNNPRHYVIITARADFYPDLMELPIWPLIRDNRFEVLPLAGDRLREAIRDPAEERGVSIDPGLLERIVADAAEELGSLPLVQVVLGELWADRDGDWIRLRPYEERGGLKGAVGRRADNAYRALAPTWSEEEEPTRRAMVRRIFVRLVDVSRSGRDVRRQQSVAELRGGDDRAIFDRTLTHFVDERLLTSSGAPDEPAEDPDAERLIDLAHESLITAWPTLRDWLIEVRDTERQLRDLTQKATAWGEAKAGGEPLRGLLDRYEIVAAKQSLSSSDLLLLEPDEDVEHFVKASEAELARQQQAADAARRTRNRVLQFLGIVIGMLFWAGVYAWYQQSLADEFRLAGVAQTLAAQAVTRAAEDDIEQGMLLATQARRIDESSGRRSRFLVHEALNSTIGVPHLRRRIPPLGPSGARATAVTFSPDDSTIAVGDIGGRVYLANWRKPPIWRTAFAKEVATLNGVVEQLAFGRDGRSLIAFDASNTLHWLTLRDGQISSRRSVVLSKLASEAFPNLFGRSRVRLNVATNVASVVRLFASNMRAGEPSGGGELWLVRAGASALKIDRIAAVTAARDAAVSPDQGSVIVATASGVTVMELESARLTTIARTPCQRCMVSGDGSHLVASCGATTDSGKLLHWKRAGNSWLPDPDIVSGEIEDRKVVSHELIGVGAGEEVWFASWTPSGGSVTRVRTSGLTGSTHVADLPDDLFLGALSPGGEILVNLADGALWEIGSRGAGTRVYGSDPALAIDDLNWSLDTLHVASMFAVVSWRLEERLPATTIVGGLTLDAHRVRGRRSVIRVAVGSAVYDYPPSGSPRQLVQGSSADVARELSSAKVAMSRDGGTVVSCDDPGKATVRTIGDSADSVRTESLTLDKQKCSALATSGDGAVVAIAAEDGAIAVWRKKDGHFGRQDLTTQLHGETATRKPVVSLQFDDRGWRLAAGYGDGSVLLWEFGMITVGPSRVFDPEFEGRSASLSPDGRWLATGGPRGTVRLWDLSNRSARPPVLRTTSGEAINAITFNDDGSYVFVGDGSGKIHRWLTSVDQLAALVCEKSWRNLSFAEWQQYVGDELPYACTCPNLPPGDGAPISACK